MALAQIGPLTAAMETLATATGAGIVLGGFGVGLIGVFARWPKRVLEIRALNASYLGGAAGVAAVFVDLAAKHLV